MKASKFSDAQKAFILKQGADGVPVADVAARPGSARRPILIGRRSMVRPRSASVFWPLDLLVCINLSGLLLELCVLLAMMGSARPRPS